MTPSDIRVVPENCVLFFGILYIGEPTIGGTTRHLKGRSVKQIFRRWVENAASEADLVLDGGPVRFAFRTVGKILIAAEIADFVVHLVLASFGLLPYPLSTALLVGSSVTAIVSGVVGFYFALLVGLAIRDLAVNRNEFQRLSATDHLTGLLSRRAFLDSIKSTPGHGTFLLFDIDHFKSVNDRYGHGAGDDVICGVAKTLVAVFSGNSGQVGRIGGEEFAVFVRGVFPSRGIQIANEARSAVCSSPIPTRAGRVVVSVSGGHAHHGPGRSIEELFGACDDALYRAKALGRNRVIDEGEQVSGVHSIAYDPVPGDMKESGDRFDQPALLAQLSATKQATKAA